jgi:hypothetical protein
VELLEEERQPIEGSIAIDDSVPLPVPDRRVDVAKLDTPVWLWRDAKMRDIVRMGYGFLDDAELVHRRSRVKPAREW